ncbi:hypothetical protein MAR_033311 [Mya arenaria]|uniref:Uncharacterized protein n=1 Tax=Mya arenaria TaxID=6604 RepID=A0ABY7GBC0_MYAAR|nr:hypothetical protein MAR_033311 [Mya arenaria]
MVPAQDNAQDFERILVEVVAVERFEMMLEMVESKKAVEMEPFPNEVVYCTILYHNVLEI